MPEQNSTFSGTVDFVFYFIFWISVFFTVLISALVVYFAIRHRDHGRRGEKGHGPSHHTGLEMTWTIIPLIIVMAIFFFGFRGYLDMTTPPGNAIEINVGAKKWAWDFTYPENGAKSGVLYVPVDRPVRLVLESQDVIHSFFVPQFRIKKDAVPGRYNKTWFQATHVGEYDLYCTEYCGTNHSQMLAKVVVLPYDEYKAKVEELGNILGTMSPAEAGARILQVQGCNQCHTEDGTPLIGPSFKDLFGKMETLADGSQVKVDEEYTRESILYPAAKIAAGYANVMSPYKGRISDDEIGAIIAYLKTISKHHEGSQDAPADDAQDQATPAETPAEQAAH